MNIAGPTGQKVNVDGNDMVLKEGENVISRNMAVDAGITKIHLKSDKPFMVWACDVN